MIVYPSSIAVEGNPSQHGLADLRMVIDGNRPDSEIHVVVTASQLAALHQAIGEKLSNIHLVSLETK